MLDEDSHEVTRAGEPITLTATEFELLRFMMRNSKRVLSKAQILDRVWSYDFGGRSNIVELYVSYLRKKIDSGREPMIHTLRGAGYVLKPRAERCASVRGAVSRRRGFRSPRTWSLRVRLLVTQVVLLAVVCAGIGVGDRVCAATLPYDTSSTISWLEAGRRSAAIFEFGPPPPSGRDAIAPDRPMLVPRRAEPTVYPIRERRDARSRPRRSSDAAPGSTGATATPRRAPGRFSTRRPGCRTAGVITAETAVDAGVSTPTAAATC